MGINENIAELERKINYTFRDKKLIETALSHSSYANERKRHDGSNERLEFLGDSVLSIVVTYVKFGENVYSPIIDKGEADLILAFEMLEAYRALPFVKKGGKILANRQQMNPMPVITGAMEYPQDIEAKLAEKINLEVIDALPLAKEAGTIKAVNVVLIGFLAKSMDIDKEIWLDVIKEYVPAKFLEMNLKAFEYGYNIK